MRDEEIPLLYAPATGQCNGRGESESNKISLDFLQAMCFGDVATTTMVRAAQHTGNIEFSRRVAISLIHQFE